METSATAGTRTQRRPETQTLQLESGAIISAQLRHTINEIMNNSAPLTQLLQFV